VRTSILLPVILVLAACTTAGEPRLLSSMPLTNDAGHVIGRRDIVESPGTREVYSNYTLFDPVKNERGQVVAYEEKVSDGTVRYGLNGRKIGGIFRDLRSGGSFGVQVVPPPSPSE
jgi:hypothetical protein